VEVAAVTRLTALSHGAGCACKIGPGELDEIVAGLPRSRDPAVLVGAETRDDAGVYRVADDVAIVQTSSRRSSTTRTTSGGSRRPTRSRTCTRWAAARSLL
jgi:hypothetical protein